MTTDEKEPRIASLEAENASRRATIIRLKARLSKDRPTHPWAHEIFLASALSDRRWGEAFMHSLQRTGADVYFGVGDDQQTTVGEEDQQLLLRLVTIIVVSASSVRSPYLSAIFDSTRMIELRQPHMHMILFVTLQVLQEPERWRPYFHIQALSDALETAEPMGERTAYVLALNDLSEQEALARDVSAEDAYIRSRVCHIAPRT